MTKPATVSEYMRALPPAARAALEELRRVVRETAPDADEGISYEIPTYKLHGRMLLSIAAWKTHLGFYPLSGEILETYERELQPYLKPKATARFKMGERLPVALVKKIVRARIKEVEAAAKPRKTRTKK